MKARLELRLQQKLIMTPQLQQAIRLLQLSRLELSQTVTQELTENPVLEEETTTDPVEDETPLGEEATATKAEAEGADAGESGEAEPGALDRLEFNWDSYFDQDETGAGRETDYATASSSEDLPSFEQTLAKPVALTDHLLWQLGLTSVTDEERRIGAAIIGNIDDDGYLRVDFDELARALNAPLAAVERVLKMVQTFDPVGVGARDLRECLLIQTRQLGLQGSLVESIIGHHLLDLGVPGLQGHRAPGTQTRAAVRIDQ